MKHKNKYLVIILLAIFVGCKNETEENIIPNQSTTNSAFTKINQSDLTEISAKIVDDIQIHYGHLEKEIFKIDTESLLNAKEIDFGLFSAIFDGKYKLNSTTTKEKNGNTYTIMNFLALDDKVELKDIPKEQLPALEQSLIIDHNTGSLLGDLNFDREYVSIMPLGKDELIIVKYNEAGFSETCSNQDIMNMENETNKGKDNLVLNPKSKPTIKLLMFYTDQTIKGWILKFLPFLKGISEAYLEHEFEKPILNQLNFDVVIEVINKSCDSDNSINLNWIRNNSTAINRRNALSADLVQLICPINQGGAGRATINGFTSVAREDFSILNKTSIHELGHNFGMRHDWDNDVTNHCYHGGLIKLFGRLPVGRTIMCYPNGIVQRWNAFSDVDRNNFFLEYGIACNATGQTTGSGKADNFDRIETQKSIIANYK